LRNRLQRTPRLDPGPDVESHRVGLVEDSAWSALGIGYDLIGSDLAEVGSAQVLASHILTPVDLTASQVPGANHVGSAVVVQHILRVERPGSSAEGVVGPAESPALKSARERP